MTSGSLNSSNNELFEYSRTGGRPRWRGVAKVASAFILAAVVIGGIGGWLDWRSLRSTPQYSLALIVDAAKRGDDAALGRLIDVDAVTDDFTPQVLEKAVELYGRGLPPDIISKLEAVSQPVVPAVKDRARAALPRLIRERVERFGSVPFPLMVVGASRYLDIRTSGDTATVTSKLADRPLELTMRRTADGWKVVGVKDDAMATEIARRIGQELIAIAQAGDLKNNPNSIGIDGLTDLLRQAQQILE